MGCPGTYWSRELCEERGYCWERVKDVREVTWEEKGKKRSAYVVEMDDGKIIRFRRCTTVIKMDPEKMKNWVLKVVRNALNERLRPDIAYNDSEIKDIVSYVCGMPEEKREWAAGIGNVVHELIEWKLREGTYMRQDPDTGELRVVDITKEDPNVQNAIAVWEDWWSRQDLEILQVEKYVVSFRYGFAGRFDFWCRCRRTGRKGILDWKTGKDLYGDYLLQLAAYGGALAEMGQGLPGFGIVLWVGRNADYYKELVAWREPKAWRKWFELYYFLCRLYEAGKDMENAAKGAQLAVPRGAK